MQVNKMKIKWVKNKEMDTVWNGETENVENSYCVGRIEQEPDQFRGYFTIYFHDRPIIDNRHIGISYKSLQAAKIGIRSELQQKLEDLQDFTFGVLGNYP
jgi:hypothetical protein